MEYVLLLGERYGYSNCCTVYRRFGTFRNYKRKVCLFGQNVGRKNEVEIVTTTFPHSLKRQAENIPESFAGCKITALYEPGYPKNVCIKRFVSHYILGKNIKKYLNCRKKPDVIYAAVPSLSVADQVAKFCQKSDIRFIVDVQDLWPEAFRMVFRMPIISNMLFWPMERQADRIYAAADEIIAVSHTYADRAMHVNKKCKEAKVVYLGTDKNNFDKWASRLMGESRDEDEKLSKKMGEIRLVYIGTLGHSYDIPTILDALRKLPNDYIEKLQFIVVGDGPKRKQFEQESVDLPVIFTGMIPYSKMVWLLCRCDIAVNPIQKGAAQSIINKHMDYAMAGLPVISTQECGEYSELLDRSRCGINCSCGDSDSVMKAIRYLMDNKLLREEMGKRHRIVAEKYFDREQTYKVIINCISKLEVQEK